MITGPLPQDATTLTIAAEFWDPVESAESAASFAALLAAIVLSIIVQLGVAPARNSVSHWSTTRRFAPICLVTLLAAAYMFVLLSGVKAAGEPPLGTAVQDPTYLLRQALLPVQHPSYLFGVAGSVLAVGALSALALLLVMFREGHDSRNSDSDTADRYVARSTAATLTGGASTAAVFLLFGYDDIFAVFNLANPFSWILWIVHAIALFGPVVTAVLMTPQRDGQPGFRPRPQQPPNSKLALAWLGGTWLFLLPTVFYLIAAHFIRPSSWLAAGISTSVFALWSGLSMGGILAFARTSCPPQTPRDGHQAEGASPVNQTTR